MLVAQTNTLSASLDVAIFPADGQDAAQQSKDEAACYEWAVGNTGSDLFSVAKQQAANQQQAQADMQNAQQTGQGAGMKGALRGAAAALLLARLPTTMPVKGQKLVLLRALLQDVVKGKQLSSRLKPKLLRSLNNVTMLLRPS